MPKTEIATTWLSKDAPSMVAVGMKRVVVLTSLVLSSFACTRIAEVPPQEIPKFAHSSGAALVRLRDGGTVLLDPDDCRFVRIIPRASRAEVFRPPFHATFVENELTIADGQTLIPYSYRVQDVEHFQIVQNDGARGEPFLIGLAVGAIVGAAMGATMASDCSSRPPDAEGLCLGRGASTVLGGLGGGAVGVLVAIPFSVGMKYY